MVLDSAFADLVMLAEEMVEKGREKGLFAPGILVKIAIRFVRSSVLKAAHFDIRALSPIEHADRCYIPALFVAAENDNFVSKNHRYCHHTCITFCWPSPLCLYNIYPTTSYYTHCIILTRFFLLLSLPPRPQRQDS